MDLLIELFSEEIPARMQRKARADLKKMVTDGLVEVGLTYEGAEAFSTPRRLALTVHGLTAESRATVEERKGPRTDAPEKAVEGFLRSTGLTMDDLERRQDKKGEVFFARIETPGRKADEIVAEVLEATVRGFPWPKSMRWGEGSLRWVRPLRRILCILSDEEGARVVPLSVDGIEAGDLTEGHRFMAPGAFRVGGFEDYASKLGDAFVVLDAERRAETIRQDASNRAFAAGLEVVEDPGLLEEIAGLVEWPVVLMGEIGEAFLGLPPEVLRTSMKEHQKFFSVKDRQGRIVRFVTVANRETADGGDAILAGNRRVLDARLSDAVFFWENDLAVAKAGMGPWLEKLGNVTFHAKLGSQAERIERIAALAREIAPSVGADPDQAERAARLAKADLASEMVYEFPELQGVMGRYYALEAGEAEAVADAARDHYAPLGPSDDVPTEPVAVVVALADKIDTLTGFWAIDEKPTGSKDPYALRRAALGVIRLVVERQARLPINSFLERQMLENLYQMVLQRAFAFLPFEQDEANENYVLPSALDWDEDTVFETEVGLEEKWPQEEVAPLLRAGRYARFHQLFLRQEYWPEEDGPIPSVKQQPPLADLADDLLSFLHDRLKVFLRDLGIRHDVIDASLAMPGSDDLALLVKRATALQAIIDTEDGANLILGFRRADNILRQAEERDGVEYSFGADRRFAEAPEEVALMDALDAAEPVIAKAMEDERFEDAMSAMAGLRPPIDAFFEAVQVNTENGAVRRNRLNLLHRIRTVTGQVADLSRVEG